LAGLLSREATTVLSREVTDAPLLSREATTAFRVGYSIILYFENEKNKIGQTPLAKQPSRRNFFNCRGQQNAGLPDFLFIQAASPDARQLGGDARLGAYRPQKANPH
jgi:hypothetical protein